MVWIEQVKEFSEAIKDEDDEIPYSGAIKAPKVLADIVEALAAAVYVDCGFNLQMLWLVGEKLFLFACFLPCCWFLIL